jgi:predicted MFS family arabinose efflux permease
VASGLCGFAPSIAILTVGRAFTGVGSALLLPASLAMIRVVWPEQHARARALGVWAACNGIAFVVGPTLGGVLIRLFDWRAIFFLVVPLGFATILLALKALPESADPQGRAFDGRAQILGAVALGGLAVAAIETHGDRTSALAALVIALFGLFAFIQVERARGPRALVPLDIFRARTFSGAVAATACMTFGMYGVLFLMPLTWQSTGRLDALHAGLALIPMATVFALVSPLSGHLRGRLGAPAMTAGGGAIISAGVLVLGLTAKAAALWPAQIGLMMTGLGMGLATGPLMEAAVGAVATARSGTAAALINVARMSGATLGVALLGTVYALASGGPSGLEVAMIAGGAVQLGGALIAAVTIRTKA